MDADAAKAIAAAAASLLDTALGTHGFARVAPRNTGKSHQLRWERRSAWRRDEVQLVRHYVLPSFFAQVLVDVLLEDGTAINLHGCTVSWHLHRTAGSEWPPLSTRLSFLGNHDRYARWLASECTAALGFFDEAATPAKAAAWARSSDRNGALPPSEQHRRMLERLESLL